MKNGEIGLREKWRKDMKLRVCVLLGPNLVFLRSTHRPARVLLCFLCVSTIHPLILPKKGPKQSNKNNLDARLLLVASMAARMRSWALETRTSLVETRFSENVAKKSAGFVMGKINRRDFRTFETYV